MIEEEKFFAWLDGELAPEDAAQVEAAVAADPELAERAKAHRELATRLRAGFDAILDAPVPAALAEAAQPKAEVIDLAAARAARQPRVAVSRDWTRWAGLAATLCAGVIGGMMLDGGGSGPVVERGGQMIASGDLAKALDTQLASASGAGPVRVALTFADGRGAICRSFTGETASGVACRDKGKWQVRGLFSGGGAKEGDYRMASAGDPRVMALVDDMIAGEPFDAAKEKAAKEKGWR
jgi:hypothetical protein